MHTKPEEFTTPEQREEMIVKMKKARDAFYKDAVYTGVHPFIEFCGLMTEYIQICEQAHKKGIDFTNTHAHSGHALPMESYNAKYLGEKIGCIYGPALQNPVIGKVFLEEIGLPTTPLDVALHTQRIRKAAEMIDQIQSGIEPDHGELSNARDDLFEIIRPKENSTEV